MTTQILIVAPFSLLTKPVKATGETDDKVETAVENGDSSAEPKEESKATPFSLASLKSEALSPLLKLAAQQQQAQQQQQQQQQQHEENKPNALDTIKSFGLERFSGTSSKSKGRHNNGKYRRVNDGRHEWLGKWQE